MAKVRIYQLAKELGMETQELLELLDQMGVAYKSHASTLEEKDAEAVREEAQARGEDLMAALARYQALGVNGVAFPERLVRDWVGEGVLLYRQGRELVEMGLSARPGWHYLKGDPALLALLERAYDLPSERLGE